MIFSIASRFRHSVTPLYYRPPGFVAIVVLMLTIIYLLLVRVVKDRPAVAAKLAACQIFVDIFLITLLIWKTGDVDWKTGSMDSHFVVLYLISICSAALRAENGTSSIGRGDHLVTIRCHAGVALAYRSGFVPDEAFQATACIWRKRIVWRGRSTGFRASPFSARCPSAPSSTAGVLAGLLSRRLQAAAAAAQRIFSKASAKACCCWIRQGPGGRTTTRNSRACWI